MAETIHLSLRQTHRYVGAFRHLDRWRDVGTARILPGRVVRQPRDEDAYYDEGTYLVHARIPAGQDPKASQRALADHFTRWGCAHEYDCCGCRSTSARVKRIGRRDFAVFIDSSRNY